MGWKVYNVKIKIHSSCEIEDFVETTHLCKLCVIPPMAIVAGCEFQRKQCPRRCLLFCGMSALCAHKLQNGDAHCKYFVRVIWPLSAE